MRRLALYCYISIFLHIIGIAKVQGEVSSTLVNEQILQAESQGYRIKQLEIVIKPIFDLRKSDAWLYQKANQWHINSRPWVIERLLPFKKGDRVTLKQIAEAERLLRNQGFLREANISTELIEDEIALKVTTVENWTLFPTVDLKREAGNTDYSYGLKDDNLLGMGVAANLEYFQESERSGYIFKLASQVLTDQHINAELLLSDTSDGERYRVALQKPFYRLDDRVAANAFYDVERKQENIYNNDQVINRFEAKNERWELSYGTSDGLQRDSSVLRYRFGLAQNKSQFRAIDVTSLLPEERDYLYPWLSIEYQKDEYIQTKNIYLIERVEDLQTGWYHYLNVGVNAHSGSAEGALIWAAKSRYSRQYVENHLSVFNLQADGVYQSKSLASTHYFALSYEHFYRSQESQTWYFKASAEFADKPYIDRPIAIGGETGLRGYPKQYQHGNKKYLLNIEKRFYPKINILQLMDIAFVGFIDVGQALGDSPYQNQEDGVLASAGLGLRLFLSRASSGNIININLAQPINSEFVDDLDLSVVVRSRF